MVMMLGILRLDAFFTRPDCSVYTGQRHILFSLEGEAIQGLVTFGALALYITVSDKYFADAAAASDKYFADAVAASDKFFSDALAASEKQFLNDLAASEKLFLESIAQSTVIDSDRETLNAVVKSLPNYMETPNDRLSSTEIRSSSDGADRDIKEFNDRADMKFKSSTERLDSEIKTLLAEVRTSNERTTAEITQLKDAVVKLTEVLTESKQRKGFFNF